MTLLTVAIPGVGERAFDRSQLLTLHTRVVRALEASLPDEGKAWRDDPARARTSGVLATDKLAKNKKRTRRKAA